MLGLRRLESSASPVLRCCFHIIRQLAYHCPLWSRTCFVTSCAFLIGFGCLPPGDGNAPRPPAAAAAAAAAAIAAAILAYHPGLLLFFFRFTRACFPPGQGNIEDDPSQMKVFPGMPKVEAVEATHIGYGNMKKENQDRTLAVPNFAGNPSMFLAAVFDGHGQNGEQCAEFAKTTVPKFLAEELGELHREDPFGALTQAFTRADADMARRMGKDAVEFSGTTGTVALLQGSRLFVACVGDSRAVISVKDGRATDVRELSRDHRPNLPDECHRVMQAGGRVEPKKLPSGDFVGPTRVWLAEQQLPGLLVTRSLGDSVGFLIISTAPRRAAKKSERASEQASSRLELLCLSL